MASGVAERDAQVAICKAIADRSVSVRVLNPFTIERLHKLGFFSGRIGEKADFFLHPGLTELAPSVMIPSRIAPEDFDWQESHPLKPWRDPQASLSPFDWRRDCIHLRRADVTRVLVAPRELGAAKTTATAAPEKGSKDKRDRAQKPGGKLQGIVPTLQEVDFRVRENEARELSKRQSELARRPRLQQAILAAAKHYQGQGKTHKEAWGAIEKTPYVTDKGETVVIRDGKMGVRSRGGAQKRRAITMNQWRQRYWPTAASKPG